MIDFNWVDLIDILIVSFLIYLIIKFFKGTRAVHMLTGLLMVVFLAMIAYILDLSAMKWIVRGLGDLWIVVFVIVFQPEIRRALTNLGRSSRIDYLLKEDIKRVASEVSEAVGVLSDKRMGALIAIERKVTLEAYIRTGIKMEAVVSSDLLVSIFSIYSPLHDGAVIIQGEQIVAAKSILPLTDHPDLSPSLGTRHRAAIGLTEETDAICVVVSEETGKISLAVGGDFFGELEVEGLERRVKTLLGA
ncbi:diadenylate cyclase CdaA [candidate division WOR-3 bacterium]|nr:diadenylate cyclase CdaA [candidate division WOR-3 bacterium]MCK4527867.1 diadenylate cyclase CdaA [candidate division WOR-3 bacterium]